MKNTANRLFFTSIRRESECWTSAVSHINGGIVSARYDNASISSTSELAYRTPDSAVFIDELYFEISSILS